LVLVYTETTVDKFKPFPNGNCGSKRCSRGQYCFRLKEKSHVSECRRKYRRFCRFNNKCQRKYGHGFVCYRNINTNYGKCVRYPFSKRYLHKRKNLKNKRHGLTKGQLNRKKSELLIEIKRIQDEKKELHKKTVASQKFCRKQNRKYKEKRARRRAMIKREKKIAQMKKKEERKRRREIRRLEKKDC